MNNVLLINAIIANSNLSDAEKVAAIANIGQRVVGTESAKPLTPTARRNLARKAAAAKGRQAARSATPKAEAAATPKVEAAAAPKVLAYHRAIGASTTTEVALATLGVGEVFSGKAHTAQYAVVATDDTGAFVYGAHPKGDLDVDGVACFAFPAARVVFHHTAK